MCIISYIYVMYYIICHSLFLLFFPTWWKSASLHASTSSKVGIRPLRPSELFHLNFRWVLFFFGVQLRQQVKSRFLDESFLGFFGMKVLVCFFLIHSSIPFASHFHWGQFLCVWFLWKIFLFKFTELENVLDNHSQRIARME